MDFEKFINDIEKNEWAVFGVEVYENSVLTHSYGDTCNNIHEIYSATKSILSVAFGIAYDRGLVDVQKSVLEYLPASKIRKLSEKQKGIENEKAYIFYCRFVIGCINLHGTGKKQRAENRKN